MLSSTLKRLLDGERLEREEARDVVAKLLANDVAPAQVAALLTLIQSRRATAEELAGFADGVAAAAIPFPAEVAGAIDTCGTGGDGRGTLNLSTAAALVAAAAGATVLKHGNRAATSKSGSADLLERLGIAIDLDAAAAIECARAHRFAFLFARRYHPLLAKLAPIRASIGFPTLFNLLGPLVNPARVRRQVLGVHDRAAQERVAAALRLRGCDHALVIHGDGGEGGVDEATPAGPLRVLVVRADHPIREELRDPQTLGVPRAPLAALKVASAEESAARVTAVLRGEGGTARDAVLLNAGLALEVAGVAEDWRSGFAVAARALDDGSARRLVETLRGQAGAPA
jgi:anthranilate phosphoribosyltransferase